MAWMLINNELRRCGRKRRRPNSGTRDIWQGKQRKTTAKLSQGCRWTGLDPYNISPEYKTEESPLQYPARWFPLALRRYQTSERMPWYVMTEVLSISDTDKIHIYEFYRHTGRRNARQYGTNSPQNTHHISENGTLHSQDCDTLNFAIVINFVVWSTNPSFSLHSHSFVNLCFFHPFPAPFFVNLMFICLFIHGSFTLLSVQWRLYSEEQKNDQWIQNQRGREERCPGVVRGTAVDFAWRQRGIPRGSESAQTVLGPKSESAMWKWRNEC